MISNERQSTFLSKVKRIIVPEPFANPDQERSVDIFLTITLASLSGLGLVLANRLFRSDFDQFPSMLAVSGALLGAILLLSLGYLWWAKSVTLWSMLIFVSYQCFKDDGIHDLAVFAYPGILVMAGLLLSRVQFAVYASTALASLATVGYLETIGVIQSDFSVRTNLVTIIDIIVIVFVTGITIRLLSDALLRSIRQTKDHEEAITKQNEELRKSEERYHALFEGANDAIVILKEWQFIDCNSMTLTMFGCQDRSEIVGHSPVEFSPPRQPDGTDSKEQALKVIKAALGGSPQRFNWVHARKDGTLFDAEVSLSALTSGEDVFVQALVRDITRRKAAESALRDSEERFRTLFESQGEGTGIVDETERFILCNPAADSILGVSTGGLVGKSLKEFVSPEQWRLIQSQTRMRRSGSRSTYEMEIVRPDGETRLLMVTATPRYQAGKYIGAFGIFRDITDQQRLQHQLIQSQRIQSLGTLAGGVAHDFNNILSIILGYTTELEKGRSEPARHAEAIRTIQNAVGRGAALVQQILTFARRTEVTFGPVVLPDLVRELIPMLERTFPKFITFRRECEKDLPLIHADHTQIHQALLNLCVNARDAMPRGGEILIRLSTLTPQEVASRFSEAEDYRYVCLSVSDSGTGMDEATRSRVFDPFFTTKDMGKGTGLGLSVVYGIVQGHKGFIEVESMQDVGSTFRLYFPSRVDVVARRLDEEREGEIRGGTETILLVEDEGPLRNLMRMRLEAKGYTVIEAGDGLQAVESFSRHQHEIALVFMDFGLPGMAGADVYRKIRETSSGVHVIFAGGFVMPEAKNELVKEGVGTFFQKPYHPSEILATVRSILDGESVPPHGMAEKREGD